MDMKNRWSVVFQHIFFWLLFASFSSVHAELRSDNEPQPDAFSVQPQETQQFLENGSLNQQQPVCPSCSEKGEKSSMRKMGPLAFNFNFFKSEPAFQSVVFSPDIDGDGNHDQCVLFIASKDFRESYLTCETAGHEPFETENIDPGHTEGRAFVDHNGDGRDDFCRVVGNKINVHAGLRCAISQGTSFSPDILWPGDGKFDWGYANMRKWKDVNGDGMVDFCRAVKNKSERHWWCELSNGNGFSGRLEFPGEP